jgi:hypothetical protein
MEAPRSLLRHHAVTLLLALGIVYVFVTGTLPALMDREEVRQRRAAVEGDIERLQADVELLQQWNAAAELDPLTQERLRERWRLAPDVGGYRQLPDPEPGAEPAEPGGAQATPPASPLSHGR